MENRFDLRCAVLLANDGQAPRISEDPLDVIWIGVTDYKVSHWLRRNPGELLLCVPDRTGELENVESDDAIVPDYVGRVGAHRTSLGPIHISPQELQIRGRCDLPLCVRYRDPSGQSNDGRESQSKRLFIFHRKHSNPSVFSICDRGNRV